VSAVVATRRDPLPNATAADFKAAMRRLAGGVTVITSRHGTSANGMTATAVCSVSADPPLVLVVVNRSSASHPLIAKGGAFAINVLAEDQTELARYFAGGDAKTFDGAPHDVGPTGCPLLSGCVARFECVLENAHDEGSHTIFVGRAIQASSEERRPLAYHDAAFHALRPL
jgi:flavin reductase (DIM6/NTAB) family NADH-FMN oxidoreductase RutF